MAKVPLRLVSKSPFRGKSFHSAAISVMPPGSYLKNAPNSHLNCVFKIGYNTGINYPLNVISYAQIAFKNAYFNWSSQCACAVPSVCLMTLTVSMGTGVSNSSCSDAMTLPVTTASFF